MRANDKLICVVGPAGAGKNTIGNLLIGFFPVLQWVVTATTRKRRSNERHGVHYFFRWRFTFWLMVQFDRFIGQYIGWKFLIEHKVTHGNFYGLPVSSIRKALQQGVPIIQIDYRGAREVKERYPSTLVVFIDVESPAVILARLKARGDKEKDVNTRLATALEERKHSQEFDFYIVNREGVKGEEGRVAAEELRFVIGNYLLQPSPQEARLSAAVQSSLDSHRRPE